MSQSSRERRPARVLALACVLTLLALALMVWSVLDPRPGPVMIAMTVAQGLGALAALCFVGVVVADLRRSRVLE